MRMLDANGAKSATFAPKFEAGATPEDKMSA